MSTDHGDIYRAVIIIRNADGTVSLYPTPPTTDMAEYTRLVDISKAVLEGRGIPKEQRNG